MSDTLKHPTYDLLKIIVRSGYILSYSEFLDLIKTDNTLNNLSEHDKKLYYDCILTLVIRYDITKIKTDEKNKYNIIYPGLDIISSSCIMMSRCYDLTIFEDYIMLFYQELKIDINPCIYRIIDQYINIHIALCKAKDMIDILLKYNLVIDQKVLDYVKKYKDLYAYIEKHMYPVIKDPGYD